MNEKKEINDVEDKNYIKVDTNKIIFCPQCNAYIIYIKGMIENEFNYFPPSSTSSFPSPRYRCDNCKNPRVQNVFVDEAKVYFNSENNIKKRKFIGTDCSSIQIRNYSRKVITNMDN